MKYFKNTELAKLYHVSEKSVRNWTEAAQRGKLDLQLHESKGKWYIADTANNSQVIEGLVEKGKKFRNRRALKALAPNPAFYDLYTSKQIFDIFTNIDIHREIPHQYSYFGDGAGQWDNYTQKLFDDEAPNSLKNTIELLHINTAYLDTLLEGRTHVNIIDIGPGNCLPVKHLLEHLAKKGLLKRYIGLDASDDILEIAKRNINTWFGDSVTFEGYSRDINYDRFDDLLIADPLGPDGINIVLFIGGTISNFREPNRALATIHDSMGRDDLMLLSKKLDTEKARRYFDFTKAQGSGNMPFNFFGKSVLDLLGMDGSLYKVEQFFDEQHMVRRTQVRMNVAVSIAFDIDGGKRLLELNKDDGILLWRVRHQSVAETVNQLSDSQFEILQVSRSKDLEYVLAISKVRLDDQVSS